MFYSTLYLWFHKLFDRTYIIIHNNGYKPETLPTMDLSGYTLYLNTSLTANDFVLSSETQFVAYQTVIAYK